MLKARAVSSAETREHLEDAHKRVQSVAKVQKHLRPSGGHDRIEVSSYLEKLCASLARSMVRDQTKTTVKVIAENNIIAPSDAVSLGLVVTELVINAIKRAFPGDRADALILVTYESDQSNWKLVVSGNGAGMSVAPAKNGGLGTSIVAALAKQLEATVEIGDEENGFSVALTRVSYTSRMPKAN
jgi:chemotaxis protein methyltransferase CheR